MKKKTCAFALSTMLLGTFLPITQIHAETSSVITKETSTTKPSESTNTSLSRSSPLPTTTVQNKSNRSNTSDGNIAEGENGTSKWYISANGVLHIGSGTLADQPRSPLDDATSWGYIDYADKVSSVELDGPIIAAPDSHNLFGDLHAKTIKGLNNLDTSKVTDMSDMFFGTFVESLDLSTFNTSNVTNMSNMFGMMDNIQSLDLSTFNTSNVTNMSNMFLGDDKLSQLNISSFDTSKVTNVSRMFQDIAVTNLDLSNFVISSEADQSGFLFELHNLKVLTLGSSIAKMTLSGLGDIATYDDFNSLQYTGKWQSVGTGTVDSPKGATIWSSDELSQNYSPQYSGTYVWQKKNNPVNAGDVTTRYVDTDGNKISDDVVESGKVGDPYTTKQKTIDGYTFKEVQGNATGKYTDKAQTVTYVYTKDPVNAGDITTRYVDTDGNKISDDVVESGKIGDPYTTKQKTIDGYTFKEVQGNATGKFTDKAQTVTYIYTKNNVNPTPFPDDHSKIKPGDEKKFSENKVALPQTGENNGFSIIEMIFGLLLILGATVMITLKRKR